MRVALTGAATGIGVELVVRLKRDGHEVVVFDITEPQANVDRWIQTDLGEAASIAESLDAADGQFDALVNNAGLPPREGLAEAVLRVNYFGLKTFLDGLVEKLQPGASIVSTASRAGAMWRDNLDEVKALMALDPADLGSFIADRNIDATRAYNLSKEAVIVLTMAQTQAMHARKIRINSVSPAAVSTGILPDFTAAFGDKVAKNLARVGRAGEPGEIADVIVFLLSPQSHWINGQDLVIDGGMGAMIASEMMGL